MAAAADTFPNISKGNIVKLLGAKSIKKGENWELADELIPDEKTAKPWLKNASGNYYKNNDKKKKYVNRTFRNKGKNKNGRFYGKTEKTAQNIFERFQSQLHKARIDNLKAEIDRIGVTANKAQQLKELKEAYEETKSDLNDELERLYYEKQLEIVRPGIGGINMKTIVKTLKNKSVITAPLKNKTKKNSLWDILKNKNLPATGIIPASSESTGAGSGNAGSGNAGSGAGSGAGAGSAGTGAGAGSASRLRRMSSFSVSSGPGSPSGSLSGSPRAALSSSRAAAPLYNPWGAASPSAASRYIGWGAAASPPAALGALPPAAPALALAVSPPAASRAAAPLYNRRYAAAASPPAAPPAASPFGEAAADALRARLAQLRAKRH